MKNKIQQKEYFIMLHKSSLSRTSNADKGKGKVTFSTEDEGFFSEIDLDDMPSIMRQKIQGMQKIQQTRVIKAKINPHGWIVTFYLSFMNIYFTDSKKFKQNIEKMYELLDSDEFLFLKTSNKNGLSFTQWSNSKIKRLLAINMKNVMQGKYKTVTQIFRVNTELSKLLFLFSISLLFYNEKIDCHQQFVDLQTVIEELFDYFNIGLELGENGVVKIDDANVAVYTFHRTDLYIVLGEGESGSVGESNTRETIRVSRFIQIDREIYDVRGELVENNWFMKTPYLKNTDSSETNKDKDNFQDLSNQICNTHLQSHSSINTFGANSNRTNNGLSEFSFQDEEFVNGDNNRRNNNEKFPLINQHNKGKVILSTQGTQWTGGKNIGEQHEIDRLFEMKSHQATTQKSIYDDPKQIQTLEQEYSFIDEYVPTSTTTIRKNIIQQQQLNEQQEQKEGKEEENEMLMNKWYEFIRERRNKAKVAQAGGEQQDRERVLQGSRQNLQQRLRSSAKKILVQPSRLTSTQKPDFKKIKQQQRKRTCQQLQGQQKAFSSRLLKSLKSQKSFGSSSITTYPTPTTIDGLIHSSRGTEFKQVQSLLPQSRKLKQSIILTPKENKSMYIKEIKVSQEFTNSLILEQVNEMNQRNVKLIKQKARKERASMGTERKERKTVK